MSRIVKRKTFKFKYHIGENSQILTLSNKKNLFFCHVKKQCPLQLASDEKMSRFFDGCRKIVYFKPR
jgi:hypothetical protein